MSHQYNISAFLSGQVSLLPKVYNLLIAIELSIKQKLLLANGNWPAIAHQIVPEIAKLDNSLSTQLSNSLSQLKTRQRNGLIGSLSPGNYPELRYLAHETDFENGSSDEDLKHLLQVTENVILFLKTKGHKL